MSAPLRTKDAGLLPIGEVSRRTGLTVAAIRYYEQRGLVSPLRHSGGQRRFSPGAVRRLQAVTAVQQAGFSLEEIGELTGPRHPGRRARSGVLRDKLEEVQRDIRRLQAIERALVAALGCGCDSVEDCRLLPSAQPAAAAGRGVSSRPSRTPARPGRPAR